MIITDIFTSIFINDASKTNLPQIKDSKKNTKTSYFSTLLGLKLFSHCGLCMHHSERAKEGARVRSCLLGHFSERLHGGADGAPVCGLAVIAFLQQVLAALVVGMLVEDPPAAQDPG